MLLSQKWPHNQDWISGNISEHANMEEKVSRGPTLDKELQDANGSSEEKGCLPGMSPLTDCPSQSGQP